MNTELTPREHDDMRDLLLAGAQRIRPTKSRRLPIAAGVAIVLVGGAVAGVATAALNTVRIDGAPVFGDPKPAATSSPPPTVTPDRWPTVKSAPAPSPTPGPGDEAEPTQVPGPGEVIDVIGGTVTRMPAVLPPAPGTYVTLRPDPVLDADRLILGTGVWLDEQGIDVSSAHGFESVGTIHPWTAKLKDGSGQCILIRSDYGTGGWSEIVCNADGVPAWVERAVGGAVLRFTIAGDGVQVYTVRQ